jgi:DNA oxidative demethylase
MEQLNFLNPDYPPGFSYYPEFINREEEKLLLSIAKTLPWENYEMHGVVALRKIFRYGVNYTFEGKNAVARDLPSELRFIIERGAEALRVPSNEIVQVLFTHYPVGAPIGWHRDAPMFEKLLGVSLRSSCTMKLKAYDPKLAQVHVYLHPRSAYAMTEESRWQWEHHIPAVKQERYSLTMRTLKT